MFRAQAKAPPRGRRGLPAACV